MSLYVVYNQIKKILVEWNNSLKNQVQTCINPIQDGGDQKGPPTSFSPVTSTNVGLSPPKLSDFYF